MWLDLFMEEQALPNSHLRIWSQQDHIQLSRAFPVFGIQNFGALSISKRARSVGVAFVPTVRTIVRTFYVRHFELVRAIFSGEERTKGHRWFSIFVRDSVVDMPCGLLGKEITINL